MLSMQVQNPGIIEAFVSICACMYLSDLSASWAGVCEEKLTNEHKRKDDGGHACANIEHDSDVTRQLVHIVHIGHKDGWHQEADGNTQLQEDKQNVRKGKKRHGVLTNALPFTTQWSLQEWEKS